MHRRDALVSAAALTTVGVAGCSSILGDDLTSFEASPGGVEDAAREETEYEETAVEPQTIEREFSAAGQSETVEVTNYLTEHEKTVDMGPLGEQRGAIFIVLSTPKVNVVGREFNPVEDMSSEELVRRVEQNYDQIEDVEHESDDDVEILDQGTTDSRFTATAQFDGQNVDVYLHVTEAVEASEDLYVTIGVYPQQVSDQEDSNVRTLMESVVEEPSTDDWNGESGDGGNDSDGGGNESDGDGSGDGGNDSDGDGSGDGDSGGVL